ncbi:unnamed protein product [Brachionus calyciflorus]|uniref:RanBP2-type domain-containing protein n=1 Tax=Brachionus calyciflorus TaxID=104777 RepID=A0A813XWG5_9BILA|nr:unnamed protein product [Brachionus calyciflorus]
MYQKNRKKSEEKSIFYIPNLLNLPSMESNIYRCRSYTNMNEQNQAPQMNTPETQQTSKHHTLSNIFRLFTKDKTDKSKVKKLIDHSVSVNDNLTSCENFDNSKRVTRLNPLISDNFVIDEETRNELNRKLAYMTDEERIELQQRGLHLLKLQVEKKKESKNELERVISELKDDLSKRKQQFRIPAEIENLTSEIIQLKNEKENLEKSINENYKWACKFCTYLNKGIGTKCGMCSNEQIIHVLCINCHRENSLNDVVCGNCQFYLDRPNGRILQHSSNSNPNVHKLYPGSPLSPARSPNSSPNINSKPPIYRQYQPNYSSQSSSSSNSSSIFLTPNGFDNPVYFNLSNSNLNEIPDGRENDIILPRSPNLSIRSNSSHENVPLQPSIPVVLSEPKPKPKKNTLYI